MKRPGPRAWFAALVVCAGAAAPPAPARPAAADLEARRMPRVEAPAYAEGRVLVRYREGAAKAGDRAAVRSAVGAGVVREFRDLGAESLALGKGVSVEDAVRTLSADPRVAYAEPDFVYTLASSPSDQHFDKQWGLNNTGQALSDRPAGMAGIDVDAPEAWDYGVGGPGVVVAVLDQGVDVTHPDLAANAWVNPFETPGNGRDDDGNGYVDDVNGWDFYHDDNTVYDGAPDVSNNTDFHGTHVGGIVGAVGNNGIGVAGVCWNVKLMSIKAFSYTAEETGIIAGIEYVVDMKRRGVDVRAINASWGGYPYSQLLVDAIELAGSEDILFVCAAGNGGDDGVGDDTDAFPVYPPSYASENLISVGAWDRFNQRTAFSNYGSASVDLFAPGDTIASTGPNGFYYYLDGTSMASPHVAGAVALVASIYPVLTGSRIKALLFETARPTPGLQCVTGGRLDLRAAALRAAELRDAGTEEPPPPPPPAPPVLDSVKYVAAKKTVVVLGSNFKQGTSAVEIDGVAMPVVKYADKYLAADGTYTGIEARAPGRINFFLPKNRTVQVTVYDSGTLQRSQPLPLKRK